MRRSRILGLVLVLVAVAAAPAMADGLGPSGTFFDDDGNVHEGGIEAIAAVGITKGCNPPQNTDYCPNDFVTRGQMAAYMVRGLGLEAGAGDDLFTDDDGSIFESDIDRLATAGITKGCNPPANTRYCPDDFVTRGQMAAYIVRALGLQAGAGDDLFSDDDDSIFESDIDRLATAGITKGCNPPANTRYCPNDRVTRAQMGTFVARALELPTYKPSLDHTSQVGLNVNLLQIAKDSGCPGAFAPGRNGVLEVCNVQESLPTDWDFWVFHGWVGEEGWSSMTSAERSADLADLETLTLRYYLNGTRLETAEDTDYVGALDAMVRGYNFQFPWWFTGTHNITVEWLDGNQIDLRISLNVTFVEGLRREFQGSNDGESRLR